MSLYAKGWLYQAWLLAFVPLFMLLTSLGDGFFILALALFFIPAGLAFVILRCTECRASIFWIGPDYFPMFTTWPHRQCRICGTDHRSQQDRLS
jgi:hypothetical protein